MRRKNSYRGLEEGTIPERKSSTNRSRAEQRNEKSDPNQNGRKASETLTGPGDQEQTKANDGRYQTKMKNKKKADTKDDQGRQRVNYNANGEKKSFPKVLFSENTSSQKILHKKGKQSRDKLRQRLRVASSNKPHVISQMETVKPRDTSPNRKNI